MRIIKLSKKDNEFKKRPMVDTYFRDTLPRRKPPGKFLLSNRAIGKDGISPGEILVFTYEGECVYRARADSNRVKNSGLDNGKYPHYFLVNVPSIESIQGTLQGIQHELEQAGLEDTNLVRSRAWPRFPDNERVAQVIDAFVSPARDIREVEEIVLRTLEKEQAKGQGFLLDKKLRFALESYAMDAAKAHFESLGFECEDHSKKHPYDLHCRRGKEVLCVEVKGTQTKGEQIILTNGEVKFAQSHKGQMALFILHSIAASEVAGEWHLVGGERRLILSWDVDNEWLTPLSFMCRIPEGEV